MDRMPRVILWQLYKAVKVKTVSLKQLSHYVFKCIDLPTQRFSMPKCSGRIGQKKSVNQWFSTFFVCRKGIVSEESYDATSILYKLLLRQKYANSLLWEKKMFLKSICTRAVAPRSLHTHFVIAHRLPLWIAREFLSCVFHPLHRLTVGKERIVGEYAFANLLHYFFFKCPFSFQHPHWW